MLLVLLVSWLCLQVLLALCGCLHKMQQLRKGLADRLHDIACLAAPDADKQALVEAEVNTLHLQVLAASQVRVRRQALGQLLQVLCLFVRCMCGSGRSGMMCAEA